MTREVNQPWYRDVRVWLAFFGVTSFGGLVSQAQRLTGYLAGPAISHADSSGQEAVRAMLGELADTLRVRDAQSDERIMARLDQLERVVSRLPGARRASEEIRRDAQRRREVFGMADNSRSEWDHLKGVETR